MWKSKFSVLPVNFQQNDSKESLYLDTRRWASRTSLNLFFPFLFQVIFHEGKINECLKLWITYDSFHEESWCKFRLKLPQKWEKIPRNASFQSQSFLFLNSLEIFFSIFNSLWRNFTLKTVLYHFLWGLISLVRYFLPRINSSQQRKIDENFWLDREKFNLSLNTYFCLLFATVQW